MGKGKNTAIVTGASSGIGAVYADRLAARGNNLVIVARGRERLEHLAERLRTTYACEVEVVVGDLGKDGDLACVESLVRETPNLGTVANCARFGTLAPGPSVDGEVMASLLKVNILALTRLSLAAARRFVAAKRGTIINIGSIMAVMPVPGVGGYSGSRAYVQNFSQSLQAEVADSGVVVQVVMPGPVRTESFGDKPVPFPDQLFMSAEALVDTAFEALDQRRSRDIP